MFFLMILVLWLFYIYEGYRLFQCVRMDIVENTLVIDNGKTLTNIPLTHIKDVKESFCLLARAYRNPKEAVYF